MSLSVEVVAGIAAAGGVVLTVLVLSIIYKLCRHKKRKVRRLDSSFRRETKEERISVHSLTQLVSEEIPGIPQKDVILQTTTLPTLSSTNKTSGRNTRTKRFSEPVMSRDILKDFTDHLDHSRPYSDMTNSSRLPYNIYLKRDHCYSDGEIWRTSRDKTVQSYTEESSVSSQTGSSTRLFVPVQTKSKDSGFSEDIPVWSMDSMEYESTSATNTTDNPASAQSSTEYKPNFNNIFTETTAL